MPRGTPGKTASGGGEISLETLLGYNLKRVYMLVQTGFRSAQGEAFLGPQVYSVLATVVEHPNINQSDVARRLGIKRSGLVAIVDELQARGYLERVPVPGDRRKQGLRATQEGQRNMQVSFDRVKASEEALLDVLTSSEKDQFLATLKKLRAEHEKG